MMTRGGAAAAEGFLAKRSRLSFLYALLDVDRRGWAPLIARLAHQAGEVVTRLTEGCLARALVADRGGDALEHEGTGWELLDRLPVGVEDHHAELSPLRHARLVLLDVTALDRSRILLRVGP